MYLGDLYGSQFISAGTSDAWGLHLDASQDVPDKPMVLKCLKARTGITEGATATCWSATARICR